MADDPVEALCLALREVGCRDEELPDGERPRRWIAEVQQRDAALQRGGIDASKRLAELSDETGWQMDALLDDCRRYPAIVPYVRLRNGVRRVYACALCRQREVAERGHGQWCAFCRQREAEDRHQQPTVDPTVFVRYLDTVFATLRERGITLDPGLSEEECTATEAHYGFVFPPDLRLLLCTALPISPGFPNWRASPHAAIDDQLRWPLDGLCFDVEHNDLWLEDWGPKPASVRDACRHMAHQVGRAPRLIPVCGHRYLPSEPHLAGNPVFSVWQADIIYYGFDLAGYFALEFAVPLPDWATRAPRPIRFWDDFL